MCNVGCQRVEKGWGTIQILTPCIYNEDTPSIATYSILDVIRQHFPTSIPADQRWPAHDRCKRNKII